MRLKWSKKHTQKKTSSNKNNNINHNHNKNSRTHTPCNVTNFLQSLRNSEVRNSILFPNRSHWIDSTSYTWLFKSMGQIKQWMVYQILQRVDFVIDKNRSMRADIFGVCFATTGSIGKINKTIHNKWAVLFFFVLKRGVQTMLNSVRYL